MVIGWPIGRDGRKSEGGSAVFTADGELLARARGLWIELRTLARPRSARRSERPGDAQQRQGALAQALLALAVAAVEEPRGGADRLAEHLVVRAATRRRACATAPTRPA